jgi:phosphomannomutase
VLPVGSAAELAGARERAAELLGALKRDLAVAAGI